jgi:hypothetical protein
LADLRKNQYRWLGPLSVLVGIALLAGGILRGAVTHSPAFAAEVAVLGLADILLGVKLWRAPYADARRASRRAVAILGVVFVAVGVAGLGWALNGHETHSIMLGILLAGSLIALLGGSLSLWVAFRFQHFQMKSGVHPN